MTPREARTARGTWTTRWALRPAPAMAPRSTLERLPDRRTAYLRQVHSPAYLWKVRSLRASRCSSASTLRSSSSRTAVSSRLAGLMRWAVRRHTWISCFSSGEHEAEAGVSRRLGSAGARSPHRLPGREHPRWHTASQGRTEAVASQHRAQSRPLKTTTAATRGDVDSLGGG